MECLATIFAGVPYTIQLDPFLGAVFDDNKNAVDDGIDNQKNDVQVLSYRLYSGGPVGDGMVIHINVVVIVDIPVVGLYLWRLDFDRLPLPLRASINCHSILCGMN